MAAYKKIPDNILEMIRERVSIEHVIAEYVPLKRQGKYFKGLCPFHQEKTPSFTVNTDLQIFKCFGCGESGNVFSFLMKYENVTFPEAVEKMALVAGISLPESEPETVEKKNERHHVLEILKQSQKAYQKFLLDSSSADYARKYLLKRGINRSHIQKYGLGYAPDQWDFLTKTLNHTGKYLIMSGLVLKHKDSGKMYDRFRNRIIFPIKHYRTGDILGFGGRTLGDDPAKYINSPETIVYHKSSTLYGLYEAGSFIRKNRSAILVEGYFDRIAMDIAGIPNTVAPCGTALSSSQVKLVKRYADSVIVLFDSDDAGIKAAQRALELCLAEGVECFAVPLPSGRDPDDILVQEGSDALKNCLIKTLPGIDFLIKTASNRHNLNHSRGRRSVVEELIPFLLDVKNSIDRGSYVARIADLIGVPPTSVLELCRRRLSQIKTQQYSDHSADSYKNTKPGISPDVEKICCREQELFCFLIQHPKYIQWENNPINAESMITETGKIIYSLLKKEFVKNNSLALDRILSRLDNPMMQQIMIELFDDPDMNQRLINIDPHTTFQSIVDSFKENELRKELRFIKKEIQSSNVSPQKIEMLLKRKLELLNEINSYSSLDEKDNQ